MMISRKNILLSTIFPTLIFLVAFINWYTPVEQREVQEELHTQRIEITMDDYAFSPDTIRVLAGHPVVLIFHNEGTVEHEFMAGKMLNEKKYNFENDLFEGVEVEKTVMEKVNTDAGEEEEMEGEHEDEEMEHGEEHHDGTMIELEPGQTGTMEFTFPSSKVGTWKIGCFEETDSEVHYALGMNGILVVSSE